MTELMRQGEERRGHREHRKERVGEEKRAFTQQEADKIVEKWAIGVQNGTEDPFGLIKRLPDTVDSHQEESSVYALMYRAIFNVARDHPELTQELGEIENMVGQNPQMMHPRHLLDIASDVMWDPRIHPYLKGSMVHGLGYALRFMGSPEYEQAISDKLDFKNVERFSDTAHFLEFMQQLYNIGDEYSYGEDTIVISRVHKALKKVVEKEQGSYLLNVRAQELLDEMDGRSWVASGFDRLPFMITKDQYARHKEDGLYISTPEERAH